MPALTPAANLLLHIFKPSDLSGFHSKAKLDEITDVDFKPRIHRYYRPVGGLGFYLCGWNFKANADVLKWSTMFPDDWDARKVEAAIDSAIEYWNNLGTTGTENTERIKKLVDLYRVGWIGNAKVDGKTCVLGGMSGNNKVQSAFPMQGANANFPKVAEDRTIYPPRADGEGETRFR